MRAAWARSFGVGELVDGLVGALGEELDLRIESANIAQVASKVGHDPEGTVRVPNVHRALCTERILIMDHIDAAPLRRDSLQIAPDARHRLATALLDSLLTQIMDDGVFHADPHPGNLLVGSDGTLFLLDFGSVGRLDRQLRQASARLLAAIDRDDAVAASDALLELLDRPASFDERRFQRALGRFIVTHLSGARSADAAMFAELFRLVATQDLRIPPETAALFRALATLEGTLVTIDPDFDLFREARNLGGGRAADELAPAKLRAILEDELVAALPLLRDLPRRADRLSAALEGDRLGLNTRILSGHGERRFLAALVERALLAVVASATGIMGAVLVGAGGGPRLTGAVDLHEMIGYNLLVISAVLIVRVLVLIGREQR